MVWFQCDDCGESLKKPKLEGHFRSCSASRLSCIDCNATFGRAGTDGYAVLLIIWPAPPALTLPFFLHARAEAALHTSCVTEYQKCVRCRNVVLCLMNVLDGAEGAEECHDACHHSRSLSPSLFLPLGRYALGATKPGGMAAGAAAGAGYGGAHGSSGGSGKGLKPVGLDMLSDRAPWRCLACNVRGRGGGDCDGC